MRTTIKDIAREAGVSVSTVSYTLNKKGPITKESHKRVLEAVKRLHYVPDATARSLVKGRTNSIGVITGWVPSFDFTNPYILQVLSILSTKLSEEKYWMSLYMPQEGDEQSLRHFLENAKIDGLLWLGRNLPESVEAVLESRNMPHISLQYGREFMGSGSAILVQDHAAIIKAVDYLVSLGHKKILFVSGYPLQGDGASRSSAFIEAMQSHADCEGQIIGQIINGNYRDDEAYQAVGRFFDQRGIWPTAILAASDVMARGVLRYLHRRKIEVPAQMSVMGFDDIPLARQSSPPLTTMAQPVEEMIEEACNYLFSCISGEATLLRRKAEAKLVVRQSTAPPANG